MTSVKMYRMFRWFL